MRSILVLLGLVVASLNTWGQGSTRFTAVLDGSQEVPANLSPYTGFAAFDLADSVLNYGVELTFLTYSGLVPTDAFIRGPASPGQTAPTIFTLGQFLFVDRPAGYVSIGGFILTQSQLSDLWAGLWYVDITSAAYPNGEIRGQILPVPEPSGFALLCLGGLALWLSARSRPSR
jgi:hypothetical protein